MYRDEKKLFVPSSDISFSILPDTRDDHIDRHEKKDTSSTAKPKLQEAKKSKNNKATTGILSNDFG